jgi:PEGA domain
MPIGLGRGWPFAVALLVCIVSPISRARAEQAADEDARKNEGRAHFQRGLELSDDQAWDAAYAEYVTSLASYPTKAATKNAALCLRMMHRYAEALEMLERFLRFSNLTDTDREFSSREMQDLKRFVGLLVVRGPDDGALVSVDGGDRGRTPLAAPLRVSAGSHVVRVFKPGFAPVERQFVITGGQSLTIDVKLDPVTQLGRLRVVEQAGLHPQVLVDGAAVGAAPWEGPVGAGTHTAALKGEGVMGAQPVSVPVHLNERASISLALEPLEGQLRIEPTPANAVTAVDGVTLGRGVWEGPVRLGEHRVEVASEGFVPLQQNVRLDKGSRRVLAVHLDRDPSSPLWHVQHPPHVFLEAQGMALGFSSLGGDLAGSCSGACSSGFAAGVLGELRAGYELSSGLGFSIDGGYAWVQQTLTGRTDSLQPLPLGSIPSDPGASNDKIGIQGPIVTASASVHRGDRFTWLARVGIGGWFSNVSDTRSGTYTTVLSAHPDHTLGSPVTYSVGPLSESGGTIYGVLVPEVRGGWRLGKVEIGVGIQLLLALPFSTPRWQPSGGQVLTGNCGATPTPTCVSDGLGVYASAPLTGGVVVLVAPGLSITYSL